MKKYVVKFYSRASEFQDLSSGEKIGSVWACSDPYIPKLRILQGYTMMNLLASLSLVISIINHGGIMFPHYHFGHPNFLYLKINLDYLVKNSFFFLITRQNITVVLNSKYVQSSL